jgi:HSP20 family protein
MTTLAHWTPLRDALRFQNEINRLFVNGARPFTSESESLVNGWAPPVDIYEDAEGVTLKAELPGFSASDIDLRVENGTLTLKGERKLEKEDKKDNYRRVERSYGAFTRSFSLPTNVDPEKIRAESRHGVLSIFLPRREESRPKQIRVNIEQ